MRGDHPAWAQIEPSINRERPEDNPARFGGRPGEHDIELSKAISLKRLADALDSSDIGGKPQGSVLWWLENIARAIDNAGRS